MDKGFWKLVAGVVGWVAFVAAAGLCILKAPHP